jgi:hypothetical protein
MILGVNDVSQIANDKLHEETSVTDRYVKSACNSTYGLEHNQKCELWIKQAHLICLFGLSFGDTDKKWWKLVGDALIRGCRIILFEYNPKEKFHGNQGPHKKEAKEMVKDRFLLKTDIKEDALKISRYKGDIYVAHNTDMFKLEIIKQGDDKK